MQFQAHYDKTLPGENKRLDCAGEPHYGSMVCELQWMDQQGAGVPPAHNPPRFRFMGPGSATGSLRSQIFFGRFVPVSIELSGDAFLYDREDYGHRASAVNGADITQDGGQVHAYCRDLTQRTGHGGQSYG